MTRVLAFLTILFLAFVFWPAVVWVSWNIFVPPTFHLPEINFWQALALTLLSRVLLKSTQVITK